MLATNRKTFKFEDYRTMNLAELKKTFL